MSVCWLTLSKIGVKLFWKYMSMYFEGIHNTKTWRRENKTSVEKYLTKRVFGSMLLHCLYTSCMCNTTLCLTYFLFGYEISLFGGLWCLHFHFVPFLSLLYSVLYALIIRTKSRRAYTSLHTKLFIKHFPGIDCRIF